MAIRESLYSVLYAQSVRYVQHSFGWKKNRRRWTTVEDRFAVCCRVRGSAGRKGLAPGWPWSLVLAGFGPLGLPRSVSTQLQH